MVRLETNENPLDNKICEPATALRLEKLPSTNTAFR